MLTDLTYPNDHSFLEEVYTKRIPLMGNEVTWIMRKSEMNIELKDVSKDKWNNTDVYLINSSGVRTTINMLKTAVYTLKEVGRIIKNEKFDVIQVRNDPLMGLIALFYARKKRKPFVYQYTFYKSTGNVVIGKNNISLERMLKKHLGGFLERMLLKSADLVLPISTYMKESINSTMKISNDKMLACPLGVDEKLVIDNSEVEKIKKKYNLKKNVVVYVGTMAKQRELSILIDVMNILQKQIKDIQLLMVGDSPNKKDEFILEDQFRKAGYDNNTVIFTGRVPREDIAYYISAGQVCVSPIPTYDIYKIASPIKLMDYLNCSRPVIGNKGIFEQEDIITKSGAGICCDYNVKEFSYSIKLLLKNTNKTQKMGENGREFIRKHRGYNIIARKLITSYRKLLKSNEIIK